MISNEDLIKKLKLHPQIGSSLLVKKFYEPMVRTISMRYKLDRLDSQAVVNKSLLKVINEINNYKYESEKKFFNWLYTIIINNVRDFLKKKNKDKERINTVSRDERVVREESEQEHFYGAEILKSDISYALEDNNDYDANIDQLINNETTRQYYNSYTNSLNSNMSKQMEFIVETLNEFTLDEQCYITMYADKVSIKEISQIRNSNETATKKYVSRLIQKFFKKVGEKLNNNNYKEFYENFKRQNKHSNPPSDFKREITKT